MKNIHSMNGGILMKKRLCIILTMLLLTCSMPCNTLAKSKITTSSKKTSASTFKFKSGVITSLEDEKSSVDSRNVTVKPNKVGIARINDERKKRGLSQLNTADIAPVGKEAVTANQSAKAVNSNVSANLTASSEAVSTEASSNSVLPSYVDNSKSKYFPPIMNQGVQGSCAACSSTYYVYTNMYAMANDIDVKGNDPLNQYKFSPKFTYNFANSGWDTGSNVSIDMGIICSMVSILHKAVHMALQVSNLTLRI